MEKEDFKLIDKALTEIQKKYGGNNIINLEEDTKLDRFPLSSLAFNDLFSGGLVKGRIVEIYGQPSNGKSLISTYFAKEIQTLSDGFVVFLDYEYSFDPDFAKRLGLDLSKDKFLLIQPDNIEQGFDMFEALVKTGKVAYCVADSTNAMKSASEEKAELGSALMGVNARVLGSVQRRLLSLLSQNKCTLVFISQIRDTLSLYGGPAIGTGKATGFNASIRLEVKRVEYLENDKKEPIGVKMLIRTKKNKTSNPNKEIEIDFYFDGGIDTVKELTDYAIKFDVIKKMGSWFLLPDETKLQGKDKVADYLKTNEKALTEIKELVDKYLFMLNKKDSEDITPQRTKVETKTEVEAKPKKAKKENLTPGFMSDDIPEVEENEETPV